MTRILRLLAVPATGAGYVEDRAALQAGRVPPGERYTAPALTPGFRAVREVAEAVSIGLVLETGQVAWGDCLGGERSGPGGRVPVFRTRDGLAALEGIVAPALEGREIGSFRELVALVDGLGQPGARREESPPAAEAGVADSSRRALLSAPFRAMRAALHAESEATDEGLLPGGRLHPAVRYGTSQALLAAVALDRGTTMAEVIAREWHLPWGLAADREEGDGESAQRRRPALHPVPLHGRCGPDWRVDAEKMIVRRVASLPHAVVEDVAEQVGLDGGKLTRTIRWLGERIARLGGGDYRPAFHFDLRGALGRISDGQPGRMLGQIYGWRTAAGPYTLRLEDPVLLDSREAQIESMHTLRSYIQARGLDVQLVAGEWAGSLDDIQAFAGAEAADAVQVQMPQLGSIADSVDALLACRAGGVGAFLGGSPAETELSARAAVHVALATQADLLLAGPGTGVDEAISLAQNEMARTLAIVELRLGGAGTNGG